MLSVDRWGKFVRKLRNLLKENIGNLGHMIIISILLIDLTFSAAPQNSPTVFRN